MLTRSQLDWSRRISYLVICVLGGMLLEAALFTAVACASLRYPAADYWGRWLEELLGTFGSLTAQRAAARARGFLTFGLPLAFVAYFPAAWRRPDTAATRGCRTGWWRPHRWWGCSPIWARGCCGAGASTTITGSTAHHRCAGPVRTGPAHRGEQGQ